MNSSRCSKLAAAIVVVVLAAAVPAGAVTVQGDEPSTVEVSESQTLTYDVEDLYSDYNEWTLHGETQLTDVSWTVTLYDQTDAQITRETYNGQSFDQPISSENNVDRVEVRLEGTVPPVESYSYEPPQSTTLASFTQVQEGGTSSELESFGARPYTADSQEARNAISDAEDAIGNAEGAADVSDAEGDLQDAIEFYNSGNFEQAIENANEAEESANAAASSAEQTDFLVMAGAGVVVMLVLVGVVYWYLQQRDSYDKLG
jgi:hypothetical protein